MATKTCPAINFFEEYCWVLKLRMALIDVLQIRNALGSKTSEGLSELVYSCSVEVVG